MSLAALRQRPRAVDLTVMRQAQDRNRDVNLAQALHTVARRYCLEQHTNWAMQYSKISRVGGDRAADGYHYTPEALGVFPRYNALNAIRVELERIDPDNLNDVHSTRELILLAGACADDDFTRKPIGQIDANTMADERKSFSAFIQAVSENQLHSVQSMPYQRVLSQSESESIWSRLRERWQMSDGYWFPLVECSLSDVVAFQNRYFNEFCSSFNLIALLSSRGIRRIWELREYGPEYEQDISAFDPHYNGAEGYWSSQELDWVIYASHESSITVGGWLLGTIKEQWPEWSQRIWDSPFF